VDIMAKNRILGQIWADENGYGQVQ
jgi:hypothetical protein